MTAGQARSVSARDLLNYRKSVSETATTLVAQDHITLSRVFTERCKDSGIERPQKGIPISDTSAPPGKGSDDRI